jgi:1-acyl-sn-glycerol-3-phosphate acyltransferase
MRRPTLFSAGFSLTKNPSLPKVSSCRELVRWALLPWTVLVYYPAVLLFTVSLGTAALVTALVSPQLAFYWGVLWARLLLLLAFVRVEIIGSPRLRTISSSVIVANHSGYFDILALYGYLGHPFRWFMKAELRRVPFLGWACAAMGHFFVERQDPRKAAASLETVRKKLPPGVNVVFFPEGTRSRNQRLLPFKRGAFVLARDLELSVLPVALVGSAKILPRGCYLPRPGRIEIRVGSPLDPKAVASAAELAEQAREAIVELLEKPAASALPGSRESSV